MLKRIYDNTSIEMQSFRNISQRIIDAFASVNPALGCINKYVMLKGYQIENNVDLLFKLHTTKPFKFKLRKDVIVRRHYVGRAMMPLEGVMPYVPDPRNMINLIAGSQKRFLKLTPKLRNRRKFKAFVRKFLHDNLQPLDVRTDFSFDTWLTKTTYPLWRKEQLRLAWNKLPYATKKQISKCKLFIKIEAFESMKEPRIINARCDLAKVKYGPYIKAIEEQVYKLKFFAKHLVVSDRPRILQDRFKNFSKILASDYSAFEAHMTKEVMQTCESQLYRYMLKDVPNGRQIADDYCAMLEGKNITVNKYMQIEVCACRMSGEMSTSLGNGFTNLMVILYLLKNKRHIDLNLGSYDVLVEGDDAVVGYDGQDFSIEEFAECGMTAKIENHTKISDSRFCQVAFDEIEMQPVGDIRRTLRKFGWTYSNAILSKPSVVVQYMRGKALSLLYEFSACPVLTSVALGVLRIIGRAGPIRLDSTYKYDVETICTAKAGIVGMGSRNLVAREQQIPIQAQLEIEHYFDNMTVLNMNYPAVRNLFAFEVPGDFGRHVEYSDDKKSLIWL